MKNVIFIAPPAAGKGTQSEMLKNEFSYIHLSTGDMLRMEIASGSNLGQEVKSILDKGALVSDDIMIELIKNKLTELNGKPFILDGFPRTLNQAISLNKVIDDNYIAIYLDLDKEEALKRILGRITCKCGKSYNINIDNLKPKTQGICDNCGNTLIKRNDDNEESFIVRFNTYISNIEPILKYYEDNKKLVKINVNRSVADIYQDIKRIVND